MRESWQQTRIRKVLEEIKELNDEIQGNKT